MNSLISGIRTKQAVFKALPKKAVTEKKSQARGGKKSKTRLTIAFFVNAAGEKAIETTGGVDEEKTALL